MEYRNKSCIHFQEKSVGAKMIKRQLHRQDDAEPGCHAISLVSYLDAANEKLQHAVEELTREITALRQELEQTESGGHAAEAEIVPPTVSRENDDDPYHRR